MTLIISILYGFGIVIGGGILTKSIIIAMSYWNRHPTQGLIGALIFLSIWVGLMIYVMESYGT